MQSIGADLSRAIKEGNWVSFDYENRDGGQTTFWGAVQDITIKSKKLHVSMFNPGYFNEGNECRKEGVLFFDRVRGVQVLEDTSYDVPKALIKKIEDNLDKLSWLRYDRYDSNILQYLKKAAHYDVAPYRDDEGLVEGIDGSVLRNMESVKLTDEQMHHMVRRVQTINSLKSKHQVYGRKHELALNDLSIHTNKGLFVVAYYKVFFDPKHETIRLSDSPILNEAFLNDTEWTHSLRSYLDMDADTFLREYAKDKKAYRDILQRNLNHSEQLDERPYIMGIARNVQINYEREFSAIAQGHEANTLQTPLKAFFGNMTKSMKKRKERTMVVLDDKVNIDQMRVIHNALKQHITYAQGPPGTGKTQTILNVLLSSFFNDQTVLVATANNHPIDSIMEKMTELKHKDYAIPFPILRLGRRDLLPEALKRIQALHEKYKNFEIYEDTLENDKQSKLAETKNIDQMLEHYEERLELEDRIEVLERLLKKFSGNIRSTLLIAEREELKKRLQSIPKVRNEEARARIKAQDERFMKWLNYMSIKRIKRLDDPKYKELHEIIALDGEEEKIRRFRRYLANDENLQNLLRVFPFIVTTLHSAPRLASPSPHFDLSVIDEAGQANIALSLLGMIRGERLLLVGDPNQLRPVVTIDPSINEQLRKKLKVHRLYDYRENSILKLMQSVDKISKFVLLRYHYRSHPDIIAFSNKKYYDNQLIVETEKPPGEAVSFCDVSNDTRTYYHAAPKEAAVICQLVEDHPNESIGIITPFRRQRNCIEEHLPKKRDNVSIGTIHSLQGDEKDIILISAAITPSTKDYTFEWVKNNRELINVGTTRAKQKLYVVGDYKSIQKHSGKEKNDLMDLCKYAKKKKAKVIRENPDASYKQAIGGLKALNTQSEDELLETLEHLFSIHREFTVKEKISVKSVFEKDNVKDLDYYFKAEFDFVVYEATSGRGRKRPLLAIELDGLEHRFDEETKKRDKKKEELCKEKGFRLVRIPNDYARRYELIRETLLSLLKTTK